jgi:hypothetical protein
MRLLLLVPLFVLLLGCNVREEMEKQCTDTCASYNAQFVRVTNEGTAQDGSSHSCWCRRHNAESPRGGVYDEPFRAW